MRTINNIVITQDRVETLTSLMDGSDFFGVDYDTFESLCEFRFVYNEFTEEVIYTDILDVWEERGREMKFGVVSLTKDKIEEVFSNNEDQILEDSSISRDEWDSLCLPIKINILESCLNDLELTNVSLDLDYDGLVQFLQTRQD